MDRQGVTNLSIHHGDFFTLSSDQCVVSSPNILVSNPPYVSEDEYELMDEHVKREPKPALVASNNGTSIISKLIDFSISNEVILICEIGYQQRKILQDKHLDVLLFFAKDLTGHDRFLFIFLLNLCLLMI